MFAGFFQDNGELEFVIELLGEMVGINDRLIVADDGVDILEENNPGHNRMREAGFLRFFVMFAEISGGVEEFLWGDGSAECGGGKRIDDLLSGGAMEGFG